MAEPPRRKKLKPTMAPTMSTPPIAIHMTGGFPDGARFCDARAANDRLGVPRATDGSRIGADAGPGPDCGGFARSTEKASPHFGQRFVVPTAERSFSWKTDSQCGQRVQVLFAIVQTVRLERLGAASNNRAARRIDQVARTTPSA
jgi:hypothetical protein